MSARHPTGPAAQALWDATQLWLRPPAAEEAEQPAFVDRRSPSPPQQRRIGKYIVLETLGEGAMGIVYKALDPLIQRTVALKTIQRREAVAQGVGAPSAMRFRNEAQAAGRLNHPGIVSVYDYGECSDETGDAGYIAMEYVQGPTLAECARRPRLPLADVLSIVSQLLDALHCAHSQNVWHRDIKPGNLILTAEGQLKVADFGIARVDATVLTQDAWSMGSPGYMAPECYTGVAIDHRVDLYACGVLLYELLTGTRPFRGSPGAVMYQAMHETPPPLAQALPGHSAIEAFEVVVARALAKQRDERYSSAFEMRDALHVVAASAGLEVPPRASSDTVNSLLKPASIPHQDPAADSKPNALTTPPPAAQAVRRVPTAPLTPATPAAAPRTDTQSAFLSELARLLQPQFGPMAAMVVRDAAKRHPNAAALVACLAHELSDPQDRRAFLAQAQRAHPHANASADKPPAAALPVLGTEPLSQALLARAETVLVQQLGPIGKVLVRRAAQQHSSKEAFLHALADAAADAVDRAQLMAKLNKLGS
jgi:eukaryotic-like serine/threonine-protein kinase